MATADASGGMWISGPKPSPPSSSSFLIRDILATTTNNNHQDGRRPNKQQPPRQDVFDWILAQQQQQQAQARFWHLASFPSRTTRTFDNEDDDDDDDEDNGDEDGVNLEPSVSTIQSSSAGMFRQPSLADEIQTRLYQNLCYYAIQQQINATVISVNRQTSVATVPPDVDHQQQQSQPPPPLPPPIAKLSEPDSAECHPETTKKRKKPKTSGLLLKEGKETAVRNRSKMKKNRLVKKPDDASLVSLKMMIDMSSNLMATVENSQPETEPASSKRSGKSSSLCVRKIRRNRTVFTELQLMGLERRFDSQKYLSTPDRTDLARALGLTQLQVKTWYQNRRMKWKKQVMQNGCPYPPTKPKGRPKKDSIPTYGMEFTNSILCPIMAAAAAAAATAGNAAVRQDQ